MVDHGVLVHRGWPGPDRASVRFPLERVPRSLGPVTRDRCWSVGSILRVSNDKELHDYPSSSESPEGSSSFHTGRKWRDHPLSNDEGGSLQLHWSSCHVRVRSSFTNTYDSPLAVSGEESDKEGDKDIKVA
ncbi:hypothetical protein Q3G72_021219 [Acer saccharum]|nr:hypothetical protein Q3G72_021219 [Acer saccharum]